MVPIFNNQIKKYFYIVACFATEDAVQIGNWFY
jgi:hypothetical protein